MKRGIILGFMLFFSLTAYLQLNESALIYPDNIPEPVYDFKKNPLSDSKIELGRVLFYDPLLSNDGTISCSSSIITFNHIPICIIEFPDCSSVNKITP